MKWSSCVALALCTFWAGAGLANDPGASRSATVGWADTNADGVVTLDEARAAAGRFFGRFDGDHDGVVTRDEAQAARSGPTRERVHARFAELDRDRDGALSRWESHLPPRRFARVDRDADGRLSEDELWHAARRNSRGPGNLGALRPLLWRRDLDGDGRVTLAEAQRAIELRFRRRDRDGDGRLTPRDGRDAGVSATRPRAHR